jgi:hypothetical protein
MSHARITATLCAVAIVLVAGCSTRKWDNPAIPQLKPNPIFPVAAGNQWTYVDSTYDTTGVFLGTDSVRLQLGTPTTVVLQGYSFTA